MDPGLWNLGKKRCDIIKHISSVLVLFHLQSNSVKASLRGSRAGLWFALHWSRSLSCAKKIGWCEESRFGLKSPAFASCLGRLLASDSSHLTLSFFSKAMGIITSASQSCGEDPKTLCLLVWPLGLVSSWGAGAGLELVDRRGNPILTPRSHF